jgi:hypothetical protein
MPPIALSSAARDHLCVPAIAGGTIPLRTHTSKPAGERPQSFAACALVNAKLSFAGVISQLRNDGVQSVNLARLAGNHALRLGIGKRPLLLVFVLFVMRQFGFQLRSCHPRASSETGRPVVLRNSLPSWT